MFLRAALQSRGLAAALVSMAAVGPALSQGATAGWPSHAVTLVVPFTAGTTVDILGRGFADYAADKLGQPVVIDNRGGAGGTTGGAAVAKATPDGYTVLLSTTGPASISKLMFKSMPYDPERDLAPVVLLGKSPVIIVGKPTLPAGNLAELITHLKANPDKLTAGYPGNGTLGHITGELLQKETGTRFAAVQHRGSASIIADLLGGHLDIGMDSTAPYVAQVLDGKLKGLAIASSTRWPQLPQVPTVCESSLPGFEATVWYALLVPTGTPRVVIDKINAVANEFLTTPKARASFVTNSIIAGGGTPDDLTKFIGSEFAKWGPVIKSANITF